MSNYTEISYFSREFHKQCCYNMSLTGFFFCDKALGIYVQIVCVDIIKTMT